MSIPKNISKEHVFKAIERIESEGIPEKRESKRFSVLFNGKYYPPKYVISIANIYANGFEYSSSEFSGGDETNRFLSKLGFTIVEGVTMRVPELEPGKRSREYNLYADSIRDKVVYEYIFNSRSHRWLDEHVIGLSSVEGRGYEAMNVLHFIGIKEIHKGIFKGLSITEAITVLENQDTSFDKVIQCLHRYEESVKSNIDAVNDLVRFIATDTNGMEITMTEKEQVIKSRIGQSAYKKSLLASSKKCSLCGIADERFLIASHIKPWSQSSNQERLDVNNGLLLCPNHDALFDKGFISFNEKGDILISDSLDESTKLLLGINSTMNVRFNEKQLVYIKWHRENLFQKEKTLAKC